jgi:hypothetical protein
MMAFRCIGSNTGALCYSVAYDDLKKVKQSHNTPVEAQGGEDV